MTSRQKLRSEETKQAILSAAGELFAERGYDTVTMREIAKVAGCSHTAIYIYFKDKEALLHRLAIGPLESLRADMVSALAEEALSPDERLILICRRFVTFCLNNRNMYDVLFMANASRVDVPEPALEVQKVRNQMFGLLMRAILEALPPGQTDEQVLAYARILFFTVNGIIGTYRPNAEEPAEAVLARVGATFDLAFTVLLAGFRETIKRGAEGK